MLFCSCGNLGEKKTYFVFNYSPNLHTHLVQSSRWILKHTFHSLGFSFFSPKSNYRLISSFLPGVSNQPFRKSVPDQWLQQQNQTNWAVACLFPKCLINTFLSLSFQMATLLCIPQFIALNLLAHTFASGHCSLRHAGERGGAALIPACSLCKWLPFYIWLYSESGVHDMGPVCTTGTIHDV